MKVLLYCDHRWRDLPPLCAVKLHLERLGHRALIVAAREARAMIPAFRPDCVVLNHFWGKSYNDLAITLREAGIAIVVLSTEGAGRPIFHEMDRGDVADFSLIDRLYTWGRRITAPMIAHGTITPDRVMTSGCPRFDFYRKPFMGAVKSRAAFAAEYGLALDRPIITWATQFPHAAVARDNPQLRNEYCAAMTDFGVDRCFEAIGVDYTELPVYHAALRDASSEIFFRFAREHPECQFILKPHPNEKRSYYEERIAGFSGSNVSFCPQDYIWNVLHASDILLHRHCTTAVEAWLWDKPTIELAAIPDDFMAWPEREAGSHVARTYDDMAGLIGDFLGGREIEAGRKAAREAYIEEWFGTPDGRRCEDVARDIDTILKARGPSRKAVRRDSLGVGTRDIARVLAQQALDLPANVSVWSGLRHRLTSAQDIRDGNPGAQKYIVRSDVASYMGAMRPLLAA
ncbi:MAG: hypothetical protein O3B37_11320 [Proteobacteria bacterium]|nr:hypothetical protein [Pseudomonadota bacterium]